MRFTPCLSDGPADPVARLLTRGRAIRDHRDAALGAPCGKEDGVTAPVKAVTTPTRRSRRAWRWHCDNGDGCGNHGSSGGRGAGPSGPSGAGGAAGGEQKRRRRGARSLASEWPGLWPGRGPPTDHQGGRAGQRKFNAKRQGFHLRSEVAAGEFSILNVLCGIISKTDSRC